jgi:DNA adenine methylase
MPKRAILGDANAELIHLYEQVKLDAVGLHQRLVRIPRDAETYYRWRAKDPEKLDSQSRAVRFLFLNRNCFNGIFRTNVAGKFNVPFGAKAGRPIGQLDRTDFLRSAEQLSCAELVSGDFSATLRLVRPGDFVYLDPPFAVSTRRLFTQYGKHVFQTSDVERLAAELTRLHKLGVDFLVSYADCAEARRLASAWNARRLLVRRNISGFSAARRDASEWLITNTELPAEKL